MPTLVEVAVLDTVTDPLGPFLPTSCGPGPGAIKALSFCVVWSSTSATCQIHAL